MEVPIDRLNFIIDTIFAIVLVSMAFIFTWKEVDKMAADPLLKMLADDAVQLLTLAMAYLIVAMSWYKHAMIFKYLRRADTVQVILQFRII